MLVKEKGWEQVSRCHTHIKLKSLPLDTCSHPFSFTSISPNKSCVSYSILVSSSQTIQTDTYAMTRTWNETQNCPTNLGFTKITLKHKIIWCKLQGAPFLARCHGVTSLSQPSKSVQFSCSVVSDSLWPHEPQHARPPCPSPTPRVHPNPCPSS